MTIRRCEKTMIRTEKNGLNGTLHSDTPPRNGTCAACTGRDRKGGRDDAVSSVVALMLLLAVIATFISLYATSYVPGLKEQSEIDQVKSVKEAFMESSNDIRHIASGKISASYGHLVPLGAGDILMSPEKSSGTLTVTDIGAFAEIRTTPTGAPNATCNMTSIAFEPSYTFWEEQGYTWQYGYINVTKKGKEVPLTGFTMEDVLSGDEGEFSRLAKEFITFDKEERDADGNLTSLQITVVTITPGSSTFISGNNPATLRICAKDPETKPICTDYLRFNFTNSTGTRIKTEFSKHLAEETKLYLDGLSTCSNLKIDDTAGVDGNDDTITLTVDGSSLVAVTIRTVNIIVSAS